MLIAIIIIYNNIIDDQLLLHISVLHEPLLYARILLPDIIAEAKVC